MVKQHTAKEQITNELAALQQRISELEAAEIEHKRVEEALRESEELSRGLIEAATVGTYIIQDGRFHYINPEYAQISGYTADELVGTRSLDYVHPDDKEAVRTKAIEQLKGQSRAHYVYRFSCKDGRTLWIMERVASIVYKGKRATVGSFMDITERKRAEEALEGYSERLEQMVEERTRELHDAQDSLVRQEKLAVLGQLAGGVGHELRNTLGAIKNATYFLNMALEEPEPEVNETLQILDKEVLASEKIISSLLDFARPKPPSRRTVDMNELIQEALSRATMPQNVEVVSQLDEALPTVLADPDQLAQVFGNIVLNAVQAMPEGGLLTVKFEAPELEWVAVSFADTGVGIPEEDLERIFEPLVTTKAKGIGLGLAVVRTLVEGLGGAIGVESKVGKGSTFTIKLPAATGKDE